MTRAPTAHADHETALLLIVFCILNDEGNLLLLVLLRLVCRALRVCRALSLLVGVGLGRIGEPRIKTQLLADGGDLVSRCRAFLEEMPWMAAPNAEGIAVLVARSAAFRLR